MKSFLKTIAWIGAGLMALAIMIVLISWWSRVNQPPSNYMTGGVAFIALFIIPLVILAFFFMLIGGLIGKPKYFWLVSLTLGILYIGTYFPVVQATINRIHYSKPADIDIEDIITIIFCVVPGITAIVVGILLRTVKKQKSERGVVLPTPG